MQRILVIGATLAALMSSPALAQGYGPPPSSSVYGTPYQVVPQEHAVPQGRAAQRANPYSAYGAVTPFGSPGAAGGGTGNMSAAREKAMRDCMVEARRYSQTTWGNMESHQYRTCMAQHGQAE
jgi:hypothetical protein